MALEREKKAGLMPSSLQTTSRPSTLTLAFMAVVTTWLVALTYHSYNSNTLATPAHLSAQEFGGVGSSFAASVRRAQHKNVFFGPNVTYLEGLATCESFKCVREAHDLPHGGLGGQRPQFNWPHFFIAGYSKSATTSLYMYLNKHPQTSPPVTKGT